MKFEYEEIASVEVLNENQMDEVVADERVHSREG